MNPIFKATAGWTLLAVLAVGCSEPTVKAMPKASGSGNGKAPAANSVAAETPTAESDDTIVAPVVQTTTQPARIEPFELTPLYARIDGYVCRSCTLTDEDGKTREAPLPDIGDRVAEGDVLAEIFVPEMEQELRQKRALHTQAEAELEQASQSIIVAEKSAESARAQIRETEAAVVRAEAEYQRWKAEHNRIQQLAADGSVSRKLVDEALNQFRAADAARQEAAAQVDSATAALSEAEAMVAQAKADRAAANARVQVAQANVDHMQALLGYSRIRAPFPGVVTHRGVDTGHLVRPPAGGSSSPLFVVARTDMVRIVTAIPELQAPLVDVGDQAFVRVQALGGEEIEGAVARTAWALDPSSRTLRTEIHLKNPEGRLRPGMYATVRIVLEDRAADVGSSPTDLSLRRSTNGRAEP